MRRIKTFLFFSSGLVFINGLICGISCGAPLPVLSADFEKDLALKEELTRRTITPAEQKNLQRGQEKDNGFVDVGFDKNTSSGEARIVYKIPVFNLREGTVEVRVKSSWDPGNYKEVIKSDINAYQRNLVSIPLQGGGCNQISLYIDAINYKCGDPAIPTPTLVFYIYGGGKKDYLVAARLIKSGNLGFHWEPNRWYTIRATWTPMRQELYLDNVLIAQRDYAEPMSYLEMDGRLVVGNSSNSETDKREAGAFFDDLKIWDSFPAGAERKASEKAVKIKEDFPCVRLKVPPVIDGKIDDETWQYTPWFGGMRDLSSTKSFSTDQTIFSLGWTDEKLYLRGICFKRNPAGIRAIARGTDDDRIFHDDAVEIFIVSENSEIEYAQIAVNSAGALWDALRTKEGLFKKDWASGAEVKTFRTEDGWNFEISIPFVSLEIKPETGKGFKLNICRDIPSDAAEGQAVTYSSWCRVSSQFAEVGSFNSIALAQEIKTGETSALQAKYNKDFIIELKNTENEIKDYAEKLIIFPEDQALPKEISAEAKQLLNLINSSIPSPGASLPELVRANFVFLSVKDRLAVLRSALSQYRIKALIPNIKEVKAGLTRVDDIWLLSSGKIAGAIDGLTGELLGVWEKDTGEQLVVSSPLEYQVQTREGSFTFQETNDKVVEIKKGARDITLICRTGALLKLQAEKHYALIDEKILARKISYSGTNVADHLVSIYNTTSLSEEFARDAGYQVPVYAGNDPGLVYMETRKIGKEIKLTVLYHETMIITFNKLRKTGLAQYLYRINNRLTNLAGAGRTTLYPHGFRMVPVCFFLKQVPYSFEMRYHLFYGDRMQFHNEYLKLPEVQEIITGVKPDERVKFIAGLGARDSEFGYSIEAGIRSNRPIRDMLRSYEYIFGLTHNHRLSAHFPVGDEVKIQLNSPREGFETGKKRKERLERLKTYLPQALPFFYNWPWEISEETPEFKEHQDLIATNPDGTYIIGGVNPGVSSYWMTQSEQCQNFVVERLTESMKYYGTAGVYLDGPPFLPTVDWRSNEVSGQELCFDYNRKVSEAMHKNNGIYWRNGVIFECYPDISLFEGTVMPDTPWRKWMEALWIKKFYSQPGQMPMLWANYYVPDQAQELSVAYALALGMDFHTGVNDQYFRTKEGGCDWERMSRPFYAFHAVSYEMRTARVSDINYTPCWFRDENTTYNINVLTKPQTVLISMIKEEKEPGPISVSLPTDEIKLDNGKWYLITRHVGRPVFTSRSYPLTKLCYNWKSAFSSVEAEAVNKPEGKLKIELDRALPRVFNVVSMSPVPAVVNSIEGKSTQIKMAEQPGVKISGSVDLDAQTCKIEIDSIANEAEIFVWFPGNWGKPHCLIEHKDILADGNIRISRENMVLNENFSRYLGKERFMAVNVPKGTTHITLSAKTFSSAEKIIPSCQVYLNLENFEATENIYLQKILGSRLEFMGRERKMDITVREKTAEPATPQKISFKITVDIPSPNHVKDLRLDLDYYDYQNCRFRMEQLKEKEASKLIMEGNPKITVTGGMKFIDESGKSVSVENSDTAKKCAYYLLAEHFFNILSELE